MISKLIHTFGMRLVFSLGLLMGYGIAQATPVCNPDYSLNLVSGVVTSVTLSANCTPDPEQSINAATGYQWNPTLDTTSSPQPIAIANITDGTPYQVRATEDGTNYGPWASVTVHTGSALSCNLNAMVAGTLQSSVSIGNGQSATLVPNCPGALSLAWYAAAPNSTAAGTLISAPTGGVVSPTSSTAYYVVGANDVSDTASNTVTVTVSPAQVAPQASCSLSASAPSVISGTSVTLTASNIQNADTYTWAGLSCTGTACSINPTATNTYTLNVSKADSSSTPGSCSTSVTVGKGSQAISFGSPPSIIAGGAGTVSATSSAGLTPVTFSSTTTGVCTTSGTNGSTVTAAAGSAGQICTIAANQAGNGTYNAAAQVTQYITIGSASLASQTISFGSPPSIIAGGTGTVSATGGGSGNPVTFTSNTTSVCTVSGTNGSTVTAAAGSAGQICTIAANQAGNGTYNAAAQVTQNITVSSSGVVSCGGLSLTAVDVQANFNSPGVSYQQKSMVTGQVYSMHFKTPPSAVSAAISEIQVVEFAGAIPMRTMVLSPRQCDFSAASDNIVAGGSTEPQIYMSIGKANSYGYPSIKANTDYYINLKNANPAFPNVDTCAAGAQCGFAMTMYGTH